jgi:hypothetical protein
VKVSRREFVRSGLSAALIGTCLSQGLEEAMAAARQTGKPLLTEKSLNRLFANAVTNKALAAEAAQDVKGFLHKRFTLAELQTKQIALIPRSKIHELQEALRSVAVDGGKITTTITVDTKSSKPHDTKTIHVQTPTKGIRLSNRPDCTLC